LETDAIKEKDNGIDRRKFLKTVGAAGVGSVLASAQIKAAPGDTSAAKKSEEPKLPQVPRRKLGKTGIDVPCLSFGTLRVDAENQVLLRKTLDWGLNYWDTAYSYSNGNAELEHMPSSPILGELTWPEAQARFKEVDIALLPVGSIEQHGPHLPLDTDAFDANYLAREVAAACSDPKPLVLPLVSYGVSYHHSGFSGTIKISPNTLTQLVYEIGMSAARNGITKLVIINGHGGNIPALQYAAQMINRDAHIFTCVETGETSEKDVLALTETPNDVHAGEIETSTTLAVRPHMVRRKKMRKFIPKFSSRYLNFSSKRSVEWYAHIAKISPSGVLGDPTKASKEKGKKIWSVMIEHLAEFVEDLKNMSLDEIYHKRY